ncbi:family 43 glycosylhydrolase [Parabacteroides sp. OttesenSCG-928-N08]|nr:family 43 glycosylhydrolase [Parabacteroides sp. OttesenSCG-928-N08]
MKLPKYSILAIGCLLASLSACTCEKQHNTGSQQPQQYANPVSVLSLPDPTIIQTGKNEFYLYATEDIGNMPILKSSNLVNWEVVAKVFNKETRPNFEPRGGLWAPDINQINGKYVLYYSMSAWGGIETCGIGVATADHPEGPFTDRGKLFISNEIGVTNSIDPYYIEENGKKWLFWGSFFGIFGIELTEDGLALQPGASPRQIAGTAFEGTYIHKRNNYYYLFASVGSCCEGVKSTYTTVVGRSSSLFGPYTDKAGNDMLDNAYEILIANNDRFVGNGHNSEIIQDDAGNDWMLYHGVNVSDPSGRMLFLDQVLWDDTDWPYIKEASPSFTSNRPIFH